LSHFQVLGIAPALHIDPEALRDAFYQLSRRTHPDRFTLAVPPEPGYALRWTTAINRAYQTLRDPSTRSEYLLDWEQFRRPASPQVPLDLAEAYFDLQDLLSEPQGEEKMAAFRKDLAAALEQTDRQWAALAAAWPETHDRLQKLHDILTKQRYLHAMIADLDRKGSANGDSRD
jgi:molecular chaperone HscB